MADADGDLADVTVASASSDGIQVPVFLRHGRIGSETGDRVELVDVRAELARDERLRLSNVHAASIAVHWVGDESRAGARSLISRVESAAHVVRRVVKRGGSSEGETAERGWRARLAPDFSSTLDSLTIEGTIVANVSDRLAFESVEVVREGADSLRLRGRGRGARVGAARWNLRVWPDAPRAEGTLSVESVPLGLVTPLVDEIPWYPSEDATLSANLDLRAKGDDTIDVRGQLRLDGFALSHPRLAATPIRDIHVRVEGEGTFHAARRALEIRIARASLGAAHVDFVGSIERPADRYRLDGTWTLPPTSCDAAVHAIPTDVLGPLAAMRLEGMIGGRVVARVDSTKLDETVFDVSVDDRCVFAAVPPDADVSRFAAPFVHRALEPDGSTFEMQTGPGTANWAPLHSISELVSQAVISHEDAAFLRHHGFAPWAIRDAIARNLREGRYVVGASTITMQLVKNLFLHREKTLVRKIQEVLLTWWVEKALTKERILELYLNVIEYGPSIYGIRNATRHYFGREPIDVSPAEAAFLATILPSPKSYDAMYVSGTITASTKARIARFLRHMASQGRITEAALAYGLAELETFRFHREGEPLPDQRFFREDFSGVLPIDDASTNYDGSMFDPDAFGSDVTQSYDTP